MLKTLQDLLADESRTLAPYAMHSKDSLGRLHPDRADNTRTPFQRDRDRIIHSKAFRRLQAKTQVFVSYFGDHYRDRLTHTIEVAQIARGICSTLGLNQDLAEAMALAHDLGHPPFGHRGEAALNECMHAFGSHFEHNEQSRRILEKLEPMNLTLEVLDGLLKHEQSHGLARISYVTSAHLESQVVDMADEIAYTSHDIDDGLRSGLITLQQLRKFPLWVRAEEHTAAVVPTNQTPALAGNRAQSSLQSRLISRMISLMIQDLCATTEQNIKKFRLTNIEKVRNQKGKIVDFSNGLQPEVAKLRNFLMSNFYLNPKIDKQVDRGKKMLKKLFQHYLKKPQHLAKPFRDAIKLGEAKEIVVKDYIAGMTDHYAEEQAKLAR